MSTSPPSDSIPPTGLLTFLFTDIEDSTRLWQAAPDAMQSALARHDAIMRHDIGAHGGRVFKTVGDAFYAVFEEPPRALEAAIALQQALAAESWPRQTPIRVRMVLHSGLADCRDGDYFGPPLNVAARLLSASRGGQTLLSVTSRVACGDLSGAALAAGAELESHGHYRLKGVDEPVEVCELGIRGQCAFAPPADTDHVYRVVLGEDLWQPVRAIRHNLPAERDAFVGRVPELRALAQRLDAGARLTTIVGPAGTGKTRFTCRYGRAWLGDWPGGVYFCDLSEARTLDGIFFAVATALEVPLGKGHLAEQLGHAIAGRGRCLVILDNFEQVAEHAPATVDRWLDRPMGAAFVVTSRERLHLPGEAMFVLEPLPLAQDALDLFAARARTQQPDFVLSDANRAAVAEVVRLLDGLPLAIELAAARSRIFPPAQLVERMRDRFRLLAGARGAATRQSTLKAAIDWSWDLLTPWEQAALGQCSVFEGGFTLPAAEAVLDLAPWLEAPPAMDVVQALVDKSLLRVWVPAEQRRYELDEPYFGMYLSIHDYAAGKLETSTPSATGAAQRRHGQYFARYGTDAALDALSLHGGVKRRHALALELDNLFAACRRAVARDDAETAVATYRAAWEVLELQGPFAPAVALGAQVLGLESVGTTLRVAVAITQALALRRVGQLGESQSLLEQALALARVLEYRLGEGKALACLGELGRQQGEMGDAPMQLHQAIAIYRNAGNRSEEGNVLGFLGNLHLEQQRHDEARTYYLEALAIHRETGNRRAEANILGNLGILHIEQGRTEEAHKHYAAAIAMHREVGNRAAEGNTAGNLGNLCYEQELYDEARAHYETALGIARESGDRRREGITLGNVAVLVANRNPNADAHALFTEALAIHREVGNPRFEAYVLHGLAELLEKQGDSDAAQAAIASGEALFRNVGERLGLAWLLCLRGRTEIARGHTGRARIALAEAEAIWTATGAVPDSRLFHQIASLREALN